MRVDPGGGVGARNGRINHDDCVLRVGAKETAADKVPVIPNGDEAGLRGNLGRLESLASGASSPSINSVPSTDFRHVAYMRPTDGKVTLSSARGLKYGTTYCNEEPS